ncbi:YceI family protein [Cryomorphaceae bacterium]|nr:YceI family protein [Cryomorphaceae bacterium]
MEATATKTTWAVDAMHSEVQFKVKHLVISTVTGTFNNFNGSFESDGDDFDGAAVAFDVDVNSIDTNQSDRDNHLRSADFFNVEQFPKMTFEGTLNNKGGDSFTLTGPLTIKDTTKEVSLTVEYGGTMVDGYGQTKVGFEVTGKINRKEFGLTWSQVTEAGGVVVGDEVKLIFNVQFARQ